MAFVNQSVERPSTPTHVHAGGCVERSCEASKRSDLDVLQVTAFDVRHLLLPDPGPGAQVALAPAEAAAESPDGKAYAPIVHASEHDQARVSATHLGLRGPKPWNA